MMMTILSLEHIFVIKYVIFKYDKNEKNHQNDGFSCLQIIKMMVQYIKICF